MTFRGASTSPWTESVKLLSTKHPAFGFGIDAQHSNGVTHVCMHNSAKKGEPLQICYHLFRLQVKNGKPTATSPEASFINTPMTVHYREEHGIESEHYGQQTKLRFQAAATITGATLDSLKTQPRLQTRGEEFYKVHQHMQMQWYLFTEHSKPTQRYWDCDLFKGLFKYLDPNVKFLSHHRTDFTWLALEQICAWCAVGMCGWMMMNHTDWRKKWRNTTSGTTPLLPAMITAGVLCQCGGQQMGMAHSTVKMQSWQISAIQIPTQMARQPAQLSAQKTTSIVQLHVLLQESNPPSCQP